MPALYASTLRGALIVALTLAGVSSPVAAPAPSTPAVWIPHAIIVDLDSLPKRYSCNDLWYRFRAVLLSIGARPTMKVMPYYCDGRSPRVELQFSLPQAVQGAQVRFADLEAGNNTITLKPGGPVPLDSGDCELMRQIKDGLLAELPVHIVSFRLPCQAPQTRHRHFEVTLQAFVPKSQRASGTAASSTSGVSPGSVTVAVTKPRS